MKKYKYIVFFICVLLLSFLIHYNFFYNLKISDIDYSSNRIEDDLFVTGLSINDEIAAYDSDTDTYYFNSQKFNGKSIKVISPYKTRYFIEKIDDNKYSIFIYSNKFYQQRYIQVIDSNIISIQKFTPISHESFEIGNLELSGRDYSDIVFYVMANDSRYVSSDDAYNFGRIRMRGASSSVYDKKSYKVELSNKVSLFGMEVDDDWILDSLYSDKSKIRNKLSSDLWNVINNNQAINNDLNGEFVEVFIDNHYQGLYVLKEKVDKKRTDVLDNGLLVKSIAHSTDLTKSKFISDDVKISEVGSDMYIENFELKKYTNVSLNNFISMMKDYYIFHDYDSINRNFDFDNFLNYKILVMFIMGEDNITKNQYLSMTDEKSKIFITPWDMDLTFGLDWESLSTGSGLYDIDVFGSDWIDKYINSDIDGRTFELMRKRYFELRKDVINMDTINCYLDSYKEKIIDSGAAMRDSARWDEYDVEYEIEYIRDWSLKRIQFLDEYFK